MASIATSIELYDRVSQPLNIIVHALQSTVAAFSAVDTAMGGMNTSAIEEARSDVEKAALEVQELQEAVQNMNNTPISPHLDNESIKVPIEPEFHEPDIPPVTIPVEWETDNLDVFTTTGAERFEQELQSVNGMMNQMVQNQEKITNTANNMNILPKGANADFNAMTQRITAIQQKLHQLENIPVSLRTSAVNNQIEQLRSKIQSATQSQNKLNSALEQMDATQANIEYQQLSNTIGETERFIRDNAERQEEFNQQIGNGVHQSSQLVKTIKGAIAAYASISGVKKLMDMSDELTQNTARINMMNDGLQTTPELMNLIYKSAQNARGGFGDMTAVVAKFGNNAKDAFSSSEEVVAFANLIQKQMTIAGASGSEASNAMLQLSQALGSGVLRGDELNSIFEQAPNLIQSIADYLDVPIGQIRQMASEGQLSADVVKAAIFASADDINRKFEEMPMTWGQVWTMMKNSALMQFQPVLDKINELANNEQFQGFANRAIGALGGIAIFLLNIMELAGSVATFFHDNWSIIEPIIMGIVTALGLYTGALLINNAVQGFSAMASGIKAAADMMAAGATFTATAAQYGFNAALMACPLTWIIMLIILVIALIYAVCSAIAKLTGVANTGFGVITGGINVVIQFFKNLGLTVANIALGIGAAIGALCSNMMTAFHNAICSVQSWFYDLMSTALGVIESICAALNKLPFVEFDYSGITSKASEYASKAAAAAGNKEEYKSIGDAFSSGFNTFDTFQSGWASDAFKSGASWGDGVADGISSAVGGLFGGGKGLEDLGIGNYDLGDMFDGGGYDMGQIPSNIANTAGNTGSIKDSMDITKEDLKYLRDIAERDVINRFTTAEIKIDMVNNNNIASDMDLDGVVDYLASGVNEAMEKAAEGVHE